MKNLKHVMSMITLALVMLMSVNVNAQSKEYSKAEVSEKLSEIMVSLVESARPFYSKGDSYEGFQSKLYGNQARTNPSKKGEALIKKVYSYLSNGASNQSIMNGSISEIADAYIFIYETEKNNQNINGEFELFGSSTGDFNPQMTESKLARCCFFCLKCHLTTVFGETGADILIEAIIDALSVLINP